MSSFVINVQYSMLQMLQVKFTKTGVCHGFVLWIDWVMDSQSSVVISTGPGFDAYPTFSEIPETNLSGMECGLPIQLSFSAREIADGSFFKAIEDYDPAIKRLLYQLEKWVLSQ
ncbi:uncharacterized protein LOC131612984 [Vicia villosa]|uniref:uncharacterized protein LOC131612984 n=1 Tax=Vicia villosa TaxID=3911 RepID=UPI00273C8CC5|nr:uncharacterized protein LOC131612984 [Vicia villosa]